MLALGIRYLTGYAVATDVSDRQRAEWPPHPARVFMALAAAHFETGEDADERKAMEWLEEQGPPAIMATEAIPPRRAVTHYVPVNDPELPARIKDNIKAGAVKAGLAVLPQYRSRQPRAFPRARPIEDKTYLLWPEASPGTERLTALNSLCGKVVRIGHSSSLVQMWVEDRPPEPNWSPDDLGSLRMRVAGPGTLGYLRAQFNADNIWAYSELQNQIAAARGKAKAALKQELADRFGGSEPVTQRPVIGLWQGYRQINGEGRAVQAATGLFDSDMVILSLEDGPVVGLETTWQVLTGLRDTILSRCGPVPEWVSGHRADGSPSQEAHLALLPLAFVSHGHADGHLLGVALAFPRNVKPPERGVALRKLLYDDEGLPMAVDLKVGRLGTWRLVREMRESPPLALQGQTWIGPSCLWASVTPVVLDRHPKSDYITQRRQWQQEAMETIIESCRRQGLPEPVEINVGKTCWHRGAPRAVPGKGGFALMPVKPGQAARQQVHARLRFGQPVEGPLLLGAGRYRGYGLCKPWHGDKP